MTMGGLTLIYVDHWLKNALNEMCSETQSNIFGKVFLLCFHPINEAYVSMGTPAVKWLAFSFSFN